MSRTALFTYTLALFFIKFLVGPTGSRDKFVFAHALTWWSVQFFVRSTARGPHTSFADTLTGFFIQLFVRSTNMESFRCVYKSSREITLLPEFCVYSHTYFYGKKWANPNLLRCFENKCVSKDRQQPAVVLIQKKIQIITTTSSLSLGESKHRTTLNPLRKSAYQNLQGEKRNQNHAVTNICKFDYSKYDFLDRSCLPHDTCEIKKCCWFTTIRTQGEKKKTILAVDCFSFSPLQISQSVSSYIIFFFYSRQICY